MTKAPPVSHGRKIAQVVNGAAAVFLRDGYAGASVDDIARTARVSKATLYSYFPDKSLMFQAAMQAEVARLAFDPDIDAAAGPQAALPRLAAQIAAWLADPSLVTLYRVHAAEATRFAQLSGSFHDRLRGLLRDSLRPCLLRWNAEGLLAIDDPDQAADQLVALAGAALREPLLLGCTPPAGDAVIRAAADTAARLFLRAYAPGPRTDDTPCATAGGQALPRPTRGLSKT